MTDMITKENEDDIVFWKDGEPESQPTISSKLIMEQNEELSTLVAVFSQEFHNQPGHTLLAEHKNDTGVAHPVRLPTLKFLTVMGYAHRASREKRQELKAMC